MADDWNASVAKARKILGKDAKIPEPKPIDKLVAEYSAAYAAFDKARNELEAKVLDMQNASSKAVNAIKQFSDKLEGSDFGLDDSNKDDAKKIKDAQDILVGHWDKVMTAKNTDIKNLDELDKHLMNIAKYKKAEG